MGRSFSASSGKVVRLGYVNGVVQARFERAAVLNGVVQGEVVKAANLNADIQLFSRFTLESALNAEVTSLLTGLVSYWKLDGNALDAAGSNNGTPTGITYSAGKISSAANFLPASSSLINCGTSSSLELTTGAFSLAAWVNPTAFTQNYQSWILRAATGTNKPQFRFGMQLMTTNWGLTFWNGSTWRDFWVTTSAMATGAWNHVVLTYVPSIPGYIFYRNGVAVFNTGVAFNDFAGGSGTFFLGRNIEDPAFWNGAIDEVGVWNRTLRADEVTVLYNAGTGVTHPF